MYQPPRNRHRELDASTDFEVINTEIPGTCPTTVFIPNPATGQYEVMTIDAATEGGELADVQQVTPAE